MDGCLQGKKRGTWYTSFPYVDWTGKRCRKLKRGFLTKKGRNIHSTETGRILISALPDIATQPDMTAHWEAQLTDISQKQASYQQFMFTLNQMLPDLVRFVDFTALRRLSQISKGLNTAPAKQKRAVKKSEDLNAEN